MKYRIRFYHFILVGLLFTFTISCNKDGENNPPKTVKDIDGNVYKTIVIGTQVWMTENLNVTRFRNGDTIGLTGVPDQDFEFENEPEYQWPYNGIENNTVKFGRLYTWYSVTDSRGICPEGWHVPTDVEFTILTDFLGGENNAQKTLKENGFSPQYGGYRLSGDFIDQNLFGIWWSSITLENTIPGALDQAYCRSMTDGSDNVYRTYRYKKSGISLRCLQD
jgi:uncharacterized protein (TIGR02145 family)